MASTPVQRPVSPITAAATAFVTAHLAAAQRLGRDLGELVDDPEVFSEVLCAGLAGLVDENYRREQSRLTPGLQDSIGVRLPLMRAIRRTFDRASTWAGSDSLLWLVERLLREPGLEMRLLAIDILSRVLPADPERGWQVLRGAARTAREWITVDTLAHTYGAGILAEPRRWSEIEQLAYSSSAWERRLVGSTIATIPFVERREGRRPEIAGRALPIIANLIGDADPDVQKALSWALRSMKHVDPAALARFAEQHSLIARETDDGHRAWVIRDALPAMAPDAAAQIRDRLTGIRRKPDAPATSDAATMAARFHDFVQTTPATTGPRTSADFDTTHRGSAAGSPDPAATGVTA